MERILECEAAAAASAPPADDASGSAREEEEEAGPVPMEALSELSDLERYEESLEEEDEGTALVSKSLERELTGSSGPYSSSDLTSGDEDDDFGQPSARYDHPLDIFRDFGPIKYLSTRGHPKSRW